MDNAAAKENLRLARRVKRLEATLEQVERIRDGNASLLGRVMDELDTERQRSRDLLLNVLPSSIVARLDAGEERIADGHESVVVLMADLVGFTETASRLSPVQLVASLNDVFTRFDVACAARGVEKIKTIGDAYMAVAGLEPVEGTSTATQEDAPAVAAAELALDMIQALEHADSPWRMRIGIHSGPVVAGIIGSRKFAYDIWGDTVNVASRLESTSEPGRIQVSQPIAESLELSGRFQLEFRGDVDLKGKGPTPTWFLVGRRSVPPDRGSSPPD